MKGRVEYISSIWKKCIQILLAEAKSSHLDIIGILQKCCYLIVGARAEPELFQQSDIYNIVIFQLYHHIIQLQQSVTHNNPTLSDGCCNSGDYWQ